MPVGVDYLHAHAGAAISEGAAAATRLPAALVATAVDAAVAAAAAVAVGVWRATKAGGSGRGWPRRLAAGSGRAPGPLEYRHHRR